MANNSHAPTVAYVGLGANVGDRARNLFEAVAKLSTTPGVEGVKLSGLTETAAVGGPPESPPFLNAVLQVVTTLGSHALLRALNDIEKELGRTRREKYDPRVIDLDLLLYGDRIVSSDDLVVPHPMMHQRRFVLEPLAQLAPNAVHPMLGMTVSGLLESLHSIAPARRE